jgi:hypothetical protein
MRLFADVRGGIVHFSDGAMLAESASVHRALTSDRTIILRASLVLIGWIRSGKPGCVLVKLRSNGDASTDRWETWNIDRAKETFGEFGV